VVNHRHRYPKGWGLTCEALLKLLINPPIPLASDDIIVEQDVDDLSFGVGFTELKTCKQAPIDPFPHIPDVKIWVGQYLKDADSRHKGRIGTFVQERLSEEARQTLMSYMSG
jgi:exportin-2 (importin alpha re-exporter)